MNNYFDEYKEAKLCLYKMVGQFSYFYLPLSIAQEIHLDYSADDLKVNDFVEVLFHNFENERLVAWNLLNIEKPIITYQELWDKELNIKNEVMDEETNYYEKYLRICILLIDMTIRHYSSQYSFEDAERINLLYDDADEYGGIITACHHSFESAGECVWSLFDIEKPIIGQSIFEDKRMIFSDKLLELEQQKIKKLGQYNNKVL